MSAAGWIAASVGYALIGFATATAVAWADLRVGMMTREEAGPFSVLCGCVWPIIVGGAAAVCVFAALGRAVTWMAGAR